MEQDNKTSQDNQADKGKETKPKVDKSTIDAATADKQKQLQSGEIIKK